MKILLTSTLSTSFINEDLSLLRKHFEVDHLITRGVFSPIAILRHLRGTALTFTWFASVYSFVVVLLAKMFRKPSIIVIGGVDASREPEINYGIWLTPWKAFLVARAMRWANKLLIVDPFFRNEIIRLAQYEGKNIEYVPTGYDSSRWYASGPKEPFVLTVAVCHDEERMRKKGLDVLFRAARNLPTTKFVVIGVLPHLLEKAKADVSSNVEILPLIERQELLMYYQRAKVYCQPSVTEGLPNSICEAMLCECVPVGTAVGGIPTAISDIGFLVPYGDARLLADAIRSALEAPASLGQRGRTHIAVNFPLARREEALLRTINEVVR